MTRLVKRPRPATRETLDIADDDVESAARNPAQTIASIRPEIVPARIQRIDLPTITHHHAIAVARERAVSDREPQPILLIDSKPARVGGSGIVGEQPSGLR